MNWRRFGASAGLIVLTNVIVCIGVAYNRGGEPEAEIALTERELPLSYAAFRSEENTELALHLRWQSPAHRWHALVLAPRPEVDWFDQAKLEAVGYDCSFPLSDPRLSNIMARCCHAKPMWSWKMEARLGHAGSKAGAGIRCSWLSKSTRGNGRNRTWSDSTMRMIGYRKPARVS